jgi:phenylacetaldehyde dehydrogenase
LDKHSDLTAVDAPHEMVHRNRQFSTWSYNMSSEIKVRTYLEKSRPMLIGGQWSEGSGGVQQLIDPATEQVIGTAALAAEPDIDLAVAAARNAFESPNWRRMPPADRAKRLWKLAELVEENADELAYLDTLNEGMPLGLAEFLCGAGPAEALRYYAGWCTKIEGTTAAISMPDSRPQGAFGPAYHAYTLREPLGVVGAISPWNVPTLMALAKIGPALAAGNTVVLKPSELTPLSALRLGELLAEADFPDGVVNIVPGTGAIAGAHLAAHKDVDMISFTGSTTTGKEVARLAIGNLKRVGLELGGKSPILVFEDADLESTIPALAEAVFMNSGQICFAGTRVYVQRGIFEATVEGVARIAAAMKLGHGLDPETALGPLISARQRDGVMRYIEAARAGGDRIATGGNRLARDGFFIEPTVIVPKSINSAIVRDEIFGPVLCIMPFDTLEEAIALANDTPYGLASGVFTSSLSTAHRAAAEIRAGSVWINCYAMLDEAMPTGGYRQSGWGREAGRQGIEELTQTKSVVASL